MSTRLGAALQAGENQRRREAEEVGELDGEDDGVILDLDTARRGCVAPRSDASYISCIVDFLYWSSRNLRELVCEELVSAVDSLSSNVPADQADKREKDLRAQGGKLIRDYVDSDFDENKPPIHFDNLTPELFMSYVNRKRATRGTNVGKVCSAKTYDGFRTGLNHLFRLYRKVASEKFEKDLAMYYKGLKRQLATMMRKGKVCVFSFFLLFYFIPRTASH